MIAVHGGKELHRLRGRMSRVRSKLADFRPVHRRAGSELNDWAAGNFRARGGRLDSFPGGWPDLAPATVRAKRRKGRSTSPLVATGRLRRGFTVRADAGRVVVTNLAPYAAVHQFGLGVPRRPLFPDATQVRKLIVPGVARHVKAALGRQGAIR